MGMSPQQYLGKYKLLERLGQGGMAEVWKALDPELQRFVAIKIPLPQLQADPGFLTRFKQEGRLIASLSHPNIRKIYGFEIVPHPKSKMPIAYIVFEYIEGQTLDDYLKSPSHKGKFLSRADILHLFTSISAAIDYAHQEGVLHRDIKPANILLDKHRTPFDPDALGEPILTDFGIAKLLGAPTGELTRLTIGTPLYMSPEQGRGSAGDERSDIYALGIILYEICTGRRPFEGGVASILVQKIRTPPPPPPSVNPNIQPALASVILRSIAIDPAARYSSASSFADDLKKALFMPGQGELGPLIRPLQAEPSLPPGPMSPWPPLSPQPSLASKSPPFPIEYPSRTAPSALPNPPQAGLPPPPVLPPPASRGRRKIPSPVPIAISLIVLLIALLTLLMAPRLISLSSPSGQGVGEASFLNSGQFDEKSGTGINDGLQIDLHNIPEPASGKSYYAWLLEDNSQSDSSSILLGKLSVAQDAVHYHYQNLQHSDLLETHSVFLITEEDASITPVGPSPDQGTWKYYAALPQQPNPNDKNRYSVLDHLRHLLAVEPELQAQHFQGGLDIWLYTNMGKVSNIVGSARNDWDNSNTGDMRQQLILILDYLDGRPLVQQDLPPNTSPPAVASFDYFGLLGQRNQQPRGLLDHINAHLISITQAPGATSTMIQKANQISTNINQINQWLEMVHTDAKHLLSMSDTQLLSPDAKATLDDMKAQADYAYNGRMEQGQEGVRQIYNDIQGLATFEVQLYMSQ